MNINKYIADGDCGAGAVTRRCVYACGIDGQTRRPGKWMDERKREREREERGREGEREWGKENGVCSNCTTMCN